MDSKSSLWQYYPRQVGLPNRQFCIDKEMFLKKVNEHNGRVKKLYFSLYNCNKFNKFTPETILVDKIAFDLDAPNLKATKILHSFCMSKDWKHIMIFSTNGFWFYIFTKNYENLLNPKDSLENAQRAIGKMTGLSIGNPHDNADIDEHIVGDIARIGRMPNSFDLPRQLYSIPISEEDLNKGYEFIKEKAKNQQFKFTYYGNECIDLIEFDSPIKRAKYLDIELDTSIDSNIINNIDPKELPPCIRYMLKQPDLGWRGRFHLINYLKELGLYPAEVKSILVKTLSPRKYKHCVIEEEQVHYLFSRNLLIANKQTMSYEGFCFNCDKCMIHNIYV